MADHEGQVVEFAGLSGASPEEARQYLEAHNWDLAEASNAWFRDAEEDSRDTSTAPAPAPVPDNYTGPRTLDGRPAPEAARSSSQATRKSAPSQQRKTGIATLGSIGSSSHQHDHGNDDDDDSDPEDDDGRGNLFAGGEKSGLAVQDPHQQEAGPKKIISDILAKARANAARPEAENEAGPSEPNRFRGTGQTLGGDGVESRSIPDPLGPVRASTAESQERVLHIWQDGFSIDDGDLRRFDDPANQADLALIRSGRAPLHLMNVQHDQPIDVKLHQHDTPYQPQPKQYRPFGGSGQRLGAVVPGASESSSSTTAAPAAAPSSSSTPSVDDSQPTIMIRIQMPDGTRLPARFNTTHTVGDVYGFVQGASSETRSRSWVLSTTFPNKDHTDHSLILGEMPEFKKGGTAVVKWT
jgi:UBX domain-containing protein 1